MIKGQQVLCGQIAVREVCTMAAKNISLAVKPVGLGAQIAEILKIAILEGEFKGGEQLVEQDLQARFGVSRSPLREAFRELEKLGLVDIIPRRGTFVRRISRKDIEDSFPVRAALEGLAAELACRNMSKEVLKKMSRLLEQMKEAADNRDTENYYSSHLRFHQAFIECADNELLKSTLGTLRMQSLWHRFSYRYYQEDFEKSYRYHQEIMHLFNNPDEAPGKIGKLVEKHINVALSSFLAFLETFEDD